MYYFILSYNDFCPVFFPFLALLFSFPHTLCIFAIISSASTLFPSHMKKTQHNWLRNYQELKQFIKEHHHLPDKRKEENRGLLNWWKYNRKKEKAGELSPYYSELLHLLSDMRSTTSEHTKD